MASLIAPRLTGAPAIARLGAPARPASPAPAVLAPTVHVNWAVRWALYGMVFSIPFELPNRELIPVEIPTLTAAIFLLATVLQPRVTYARLPAPLGWFLGCLYAYVMAAAINRTDYGGEVFTLFLLLLEGILVFWSLSNLLRDEALARRVLITLGLACGTLALLSLAGVGKTAHTVYTGGERLTVFGQNANTTAMVLSTGLIALGGLAYVLHPAWPRHRWLIWPLVAMIGLAVIDGGSRGGLVALGAGLVAFMLGGRTAWLRVRNVAVGMVALGALLWASYNSPMMRSRLESAATEGNLAGREEIFPELVQMFREKPVLGWGPITNKYELGIRLHEIKHPRRDAHNMILEVLSATGVLGTIPFVIAVGLSVLAAWRARRRLHGILPAALVAVVLVANMSGNRIVNKVFWLVFAYSVAAATYPVDRSRQPVRFA
ncbi:MAG TPA: O-antigen ligase family protein [Gemmatimonadales bacterium]|nr:O-antigen ligase family protein [Gemmatimonadales bacterium]